MPYTRKTKALLVSFLLTAGMAYAQSAAPPMCNGQPLSVEALAASEPSHCNLDGPACQRIPKAPEDLIFVGTATKVVEAPAWMLLNDKCYQSSAQSVTLQVKESFTGSLPQTLNVRAGYVNGFRFQPGLTALVFVRKLSDGTLLVSGCPTEPVTPSYAKSQEDLAYLRSRDDLSPGSSVYGKAWAVPSSSLSDKEIAVGFEGQSITISGPIPATLITSKTGEFRLNNLPPGTYDLHLESSLNVKPAQNQRVEILPQGCAEVNFYIESESDYKRITSSSLNAGAPRK